MSANVQGEKIKSLEKELAAAKELIKSQSAQIGEMLQYIDRIGEAGLEVATILGREGKYVILSNGMYSLDPGGIPVGKGVLVYPKTGQIAEKDVPIQNRGSVVMIEKIRGDDTAFARIGGEQRVITLGYHGDVEAGDKVLVDRHGAIVLEVVERMVKELKVKPVYWDQIGGHVEAKRLLREAIEECYQYPSLYRGYGVPVSSGGLLWGPPGCGKTMLGQAVATAIGSPQGFISVAGPELLNSYVGETEGAIRALFNRAKAHKEATDKPAVIFIDEAESLLTVRNNPHNFMGQTVVPQFLTMMQGLEPSSAIVLLSTNRKDMIDPAILREGRIDFKVEVKPPTIAEAKDIFGIHMGGRPIRKGHNLENMLDHAVVSLYAHDGLPHSGALIEGCVNKAIKSALRRDLEVASKEGKPPHIGGLCEADFTWSVKQIVQAEAA